MQHEINYTRQILQLKRTRWKHIRHIRLSLISLTNDMYKYFTVSCQFDWLAAPNSGYRSFRRERVNK